MDYKRNTHFIFVLSRLLISPLGAMYGLLIFIFCKDLNATPLQLTLLVSSKPIVALFSFYTNLIIRGRPNRLKSLIIWSNILGFMPCLLFPFINNIWFYLLSFALFMMSLRAVTSPWGEILKINLPEDSRGSVFAQGATVTYLTNIFVPLLISPWIDYHPQSWRWIFFILAILQGINVLVLFFIKIKNLSLQNHQPYRFVSIHSFFLEPWKNCWALLKERIDFRHFQIVFIFGGGGLMLIHPVLPIFFKETLHFSYTELALAISFCKGLSFALTSPIWANWIHRVSIHLFNVYVTAFSALFAVLVIASSYQVYWIYIAYLIYGIMQSGSELSWNLSGPIFSKERESTSFTSVNVAMVGLRGCVAPFLGELLFLSSNSITVFIGGFCLCLFGSLYSLWLYSTLEEKKQTVF